ncbi:MAG: sporulation integral membrane protein YtvI [Lachnospiraceae bacterium]
MILNIMIPLVWVAVICLLGPKLLRFFMPFVIGWLVAMVANPLVRFLESRVKLVRKHSSVLIVVAVLALVIGAGYFLISRLIIQAIAFARELPALYSMISTEVGSAFNQLDRFSHMMPQDMQSSWDAFANNVGDYLNLVVQKIASPTVEVAGNMARSIPTILVNMVVIIMSSYFFIVDRDKIVEFWNQYMPGGSKKYVVYLKKDVRKLISGYFIAQFRIMFVIAVILIIVFFILGIRYAFLLGILIAILDFLPLFGTGTVLIPWAILKLISGEYIIAAGLAALYVLTQVVRQIIQPKLVGDTMGLSPLMTLLFLYLGFKWSGIGGMILAVPVGILVMKLFEYGIFDSMVENIKLLIHDINEFRRGE